VASFSGLVHYVIARRETTGFEVPHTFFHLGKEVLPVFSSAEGARRFLASLALGDRWHVRGSPLENWSRSCSYSMRGWHGSYPTPRWGVSCPKMTYRT
jgi:hypothetical protein